MQIFLENERQIRMDSKTLRQYPDLSDPNRSDFKITNRSRLQSQLKKSLRLRKHPLKPNLWTRELPVLRGFYSVSEASHGSGNHPEYVATTRVWFRIAAIFLAQCDLCDCDTVILLRFLREKLATSKLWLPIASDLWLRLRGSLRPWPSNPCFLCQKSKDAPKKRDFSFCWTLEIPGKEGKNAQKHKEKRKTKKNKENKRKTRIRGSG